MSYLFTFLTNDYLLTSLFFKQTRNFSFIFYSTYLFFSYFCSVYTLFEQREYVILMSLDI